MKVKYLILIYLSIIVFSCSQKNNVKPRTSNTVGNSVIYINDIKDTSRNVTDLTINNLSGNNSSVPDNFTIVYQNGTNYIKYLSTPNVFEKSTGFNRDTERRMMPIDLFSWCIANRNRDKLVFCNYKLKDAKGKVIFEVYDLEGAVHVSLAQNEREIQRGNNHQEEYGRFLIKEGTYTIEFTRLNTSVGIPSLWVIEQHEGNRFKCLVGKKAGQMVSSLDEIGLNITTTYTATFNINFIDEPNCFIKSNANGFDN